MKKLIALAIMAFAGLSGFSQNIQLNPENFSYNKENIEFLTYKGQQSIKMAAAGGKVELNDLTFQDGTIEFDVEYYAPGFAFSIYFHRKDDLEQEIVYLRTKDFEDPLANEAIQYAPYLDGVNLWDLYPQYQGPAPLKMNHWNHLKLVISGERMKVYCNDKEVMDVPKLEGSQTSGAIAFEGNAYLANLQIFKDKTEELSPDALPDRTDYQSNYIRDWAMTEATLLPRGKDITNDDLPESEGFSKAISAEREGLINLTRGHGMSKERRVIWLKSVIESRQAQKVNMELGFSDEIWVFLNNKMVYVDKNLFMQAMRKYPKGRISTENGSVSLDLQEGRNELTIAIANDFYGWGLIARLESTDNLKALEKYTPPPVVEIENVNFYLGKYTTQAFPITMTFTSQDGKLFAKASNQPTDAVEISYRGNHLFELEKENLKFQFKPEQNSLIFTQGGQDYEFVRE